MHWQLLRALLSLGETEFTGHIAQDALPSTAVYVFAGHTVHKSPSCPKNPRLHLHLSRALLPLRDSEFGGHAEQFALPRNDVYVFAGHTVHGPPCGPW